MGFLKPFKPLNSSDIVEKCMEEDLFDEFLLEKLVYIYRNSDLDVFQLCGNEQIDLLVIAFDVIYEKYSEKATNLPEHIEHIIINLVHFSMSLWFSLEWELCDLLKRCNLLHSLFRIENLIAFIKPLKTLDWAYLHNLGVQPWSDVYFKRYIINETSEEEMSTSIFPSTATVASNALRDEDDIIERANEEDIAMMLREGLVISLLRLIKIFDAGCFDGVKNYSMRLISAWNQLQQQNRFADINDETKRCLNMISHIHMMAIYENDSVTGYDIDNMINDVRFYHKSIAGVAGSGAICDDEFHDIVKTPAALIALTSVKIKQNFHDLAETAISELPMKTCNTPFGAIAHGYLTYLLANILLDMNKQKDEDFKSNLGTYSRMLHVYVNEREKSERFALEQCRKKKLLSTSCNITTLVEGLFNFKAAIGKGNRLSNLVNEESSSAHLYDIENEKRHDPVFQTMPYNAIITNEFYKILSKSSYKGWQYARLVLLLKLIDRELKDINNWCYHPGLTTEFMLNLESSLAEHFVDMARIFEKYIFMEQEFWLTAFYFRPNEYLYNKVLYCGSRYFRTVNNMQKGAQNETAVKQQQQQKQQAVDDSDESTNKVADSGNAAGVSNDSGVGNGVVKAVDDENHCAFMNAKYGLLSSTYDVKQIAKMVQKTTAQNDYSDLSCALRTLRLPENIIKDILTVTFSGRHANYTWAADWTILRKRCKALLQSPELKRKLVESNMAEANDRLKYLKIDYKKYQNLPQLDYGCIEEGYEGAYLNEALKDGDDDDSDDDEDDVDENEMEAQKNSQRKTFIGRQTKNSTKDMEPERIEDSPLPIEQEPQQQQENTFDSEYGGCLSNKRGSARRAAAVIASSLIREDYAKLPNKKKNETKTCDYDKNDSLKSHKEQQQPEISSAATETLPMAAVPAATVASTIQQPKMDSEEEECEMQSMPKILLCNEYAKITDYWSKPLRKLKVAPSEQNRQQQQETKLSFRLFNTSNNILGLLKGKDNEFLLKLKARNVHTPNLPSDEDAAGNPVESNRGNEGKQNQQLKRNKRKTTEEYEVAIGHHHADKQAKLDKSSIDEKTEKQLTKVSSGNSVADNDQKSSHLNQSIGAVAAPTVGTSTVKMEIESSPRDSNQTFPILGMLRRNSMQNPSTHDNVGTRPADATTMLTQLRGLHCNRFTPTGAIKNESVALTGSLPITARSSQTISPQVNETKSAVAHRNATKTKNTSDYDDIINSSVVTTTSNDAKNGLQRQPPVKSSGSIVVQEEPPLTKLTNTDGENESTNDDDESNAADIDNDEVLSKASDDSNSSSTMRQSKADARKKLNQALIDKHFKRICYVKIKRTCMKAYERKQLLPTVRLKRMNMQKFFEDSSRSRSASKSKSFDSEENSSSPVPAAVLPAAYIRHNSSSSSRKCRQPSTSPEDSGTTSSEEEYTPRKSKKRTMPLRKTRAATASSSSSSSSKFSSAATTKPLKNSSLFRNMQQKNQQTITNRKFAVVPRSASGMKVCISTLPSSSSSASALAQPVDCIEILTTDEDDDEKDPLPPCPIQFANVSVPIGDSSQFEMEEV